MSHKRAVFLHASGIAEILGPVDGPAPTTIAPLGTTFGPVQFASLVKVTRAGAYYKAPLVPMSYASMHPEQR